MPRGDGKVDPIVDPPRTTEVEAAPRRPSRITQTCQPQSRRKPSPDPKLLISLATYNEAGNLEPLVETIRQFAPRSAILVIDDNSPDGTGQIADELAAEKPPRST